MMLTSILLAISILPTQNQQDPDIAPLRHNEKRLYQLKDLETTTIVLKDKHELKAWVMDTDAKRSEGMMFLEDKDFTEKQAMVFVFTAARELRFWMRNTLVPLDIAYVDSSGRIVRTYTMKALDETTDYSSYGNAKYAIEFKAGLFKKLGVRAGDYVAISSRVKAKD
ncbi:MAG: DUF192 domain-containing protein [Fimbriimonadaceae bacterium]|nr:MAG: DUF192 domain-containing protein [Fimbriimonadaceae bacterium]